MGRELAFFQSGEAIGTVELAQVIVEMIGQGDVMDPLETLETIRTHCEKILEEFTE